MNKLDWAWVRPAPGPPSMSDHDWAWDAEGPLFWRCTRCGLPFNDYTATISTKPPVDALVATLVAPASNELAAWVIPKGDEERLGSSPEIVMLTCGEYLASQVHDS